MEASLPWSLSPTAIIWRKPVLPPFRASGAISFWYFSFRILSNDSFSQFRILHSFPCNPLFSWLLLMGGEGCLPPTGEALAWPPVFSVGLCGLWPRHGDKCLCWLSQPGAHNRTLTSACQGSGSRPPSLFPIHILIYSKSLHVWGKCVIKDFLIQDFNLCDESWMFNSRFLLCLIFFFSWRFTWVFPRIKDP